ncbi:ABC transporter ATP-binding protein [Nocardia seriolae]|uniref:Macrolide ABC transporter ATP-binding protein n=1 Tax=Nocardia seriolae TaxID=37332 RepID=A0ABC9YY18_9NOCA|nr:ABC transporter ATP-binding protein [Nocardia seriolae]BEK94968.1 ABC transporter ATP-binding protein [Nocardia seriolae]GAM48344.1 ABC transporter ATP-binding protein [Nocardia seriolae]GAP30312.1 macrolide ABC transporter ATP-binding protein [Nocardia seriolae]
MSKQEEAAPAGDGRRGGVIVHGLNKTYGVGEAAVHALVDVDLEIQPGELVAVLGASGSGKTTLLNVIGGIEAADSGSIAVAGDEISGRDPAAFGEFRRDHVGFVFQFFNLIPTLTARENVEVIVELTGRGERARVPELLAAVGLADRADHFPAQLSGGQQQRVSIARALATDPDLLLADEPTGALDVATGQGVLELLQRTSRAGRGVVMVTHNEVAARLADRVIRMRDGRVVADEVNANPVAATDIRW